MDSDVTVREIDETIAKVVGLEGETIGDTSKPDWTPQRLLDVLKLIAGGWTAQIGLEDGLRSMIECYREHVDSIRQ